MSPSFVPLRCEAGQCGRLLSGGDSCTPQCSQLTQCSQCISRPQCGWCATRGGNGAGRCLQGGLDGEKYPLFMFQIRSFLGCIHLSPSFFVSLCFCTSSTFPRCKRRCLPPEKQQLVLPPLSRRGRMRKWPSSLQQHPGLP